MVALVISEFEFNVKYYLRDRAAVHDTLFEMTLCRACVPREEMMTPKSAWCGCGAGAFALSVVAIVPCEYPVSWASGASLVLSP